MDTTPEQELNFLKQGVDEGIDTDMYAANVHLQRQMDLLSVVMEASAKEMEKITAKIPLARARAANKKFHNLSIISEVACRQLSILTIASASVIAAFKMIRGDESEYPFLFKQMTQLLELHSDLLEGKATQNSLEANDTDHRTAAMRLQLNDLLEDS